MKVRDLLRGKAKKLLTSLLILGGVVLPAYVNYAQQVSLSDKALLDVSQLHNIGIERLAIANTAWLGGEIFRAKVVDNGTGDIYGINLRSSGEVAGDQEVADLIRASRQRGFVGKIEERVKTAADADPAGSSRVNIWVKTPPIPKAAWRTALEQGKRAQVFSEAALFHAQAEAPVLEFLHTLGIREKYASEYAPVVTCQIPNQLLSQLENLPQVARVYADGIAVPALNTTVPTIKAQKVWNQGITGAGVRVAVVEAQGLDGTNAIADANPFLGPVTHYDPNHTQPNRHSTEVGGIIGSTDATYRGVSYGIARPADLLSGNPADSSFSGLNAATGWAASQGASVINQSYRSCPAEGRLAICGIYDDYVVGAYLPTIAVCAGNSDCGFEVANPAVGFNVLAVGAFNHNGDSNWANDSIASYSAYINPESPNHDREKPEIVAPGTVYSTFEISPWVPAVNQGTSFAAPHIAGTAALLMQAKPSLKTSPAEVKAIMMASAIHNLEGASRLSDLDGAGGIQAKAAYDTVANGWSSTIWYDFCQGGCSTVTFNATAGQVVRFVICWLSQSDGVNIDTADDIDLTVKNPSGSVAATSASFDNNYEIVEFTATQSGTYTARGCYPCCYIPEIACPVFGWAYYLQ